MIDKNNDAAGTKYVDSFTGKWEGRLLFLGLAQRPQKAQLHECRVANRPPSPRRLHAPLVTSLAPLCSLPYTPSLTGTGVTPGPMIWTILGSGSASERPPHNPQDADVTRTKDN